MNILLIQQIREDGDIDFIIGAAQNMTHAKQMIKEYYHSVSYKDPHLNIKEAEYPTEAYVTVYHYDNDDDLLTSHVIIDNLILNNV